MSKKTIRLSESDLVRLIKQIITETETKPLGVGDFPAKVRDFTKTEDTNKIYFSNPMNQIVIEFFKKPIENYYRVKFIAREIPNTPNTPLLQYILYLDAEVDGSTPGSLDAKEIEVKQIMVSKSDPQRPKRNLYEYEEFFVERTPKIETFDEFKKLVFKFLNNNPAQFEKKMELPLPKDAQQSSN